MYEGWKNHLIPASDMKTRIEEVAAGRLAICAQCRYQSENMKINAGYKSVRPDVHCTNCGCTLAAKTKCLSCDCPMKYWVKVFDDIESEQVMKNSLENE